MLSVKGKFQGGVAHPQEPVEGYEGRDVIITFVDADASPSSDTDDDNGWDRFALAR